MSGVETLGACAVVIAALMTSTWLLSLRLRNAGIADITWGLLFVAFAWTCFVLTPEGWLPRKFLACVLTSAWGLRLALHVLWRSWGRGEDFRYAAWRKEHGASWWWRSLFTVFLLQGVLAFVIAVPLWATQAAPSPSRPLVLWAGAAIWSFGLIFEAVSDWQLQRFRTNPESAGRVLDSGLWRFSRHPNYFGEAVAWWGVWLVAASAGAWWTVFSPLLITGLLLRVSGVPLLEESLRKRRPGYAEYVERTSSFVPWFPRARR